MSMTDPTQYNSAIEEAFLIASRRLRQALTALQATVDRLNEMGADPNDEWWQEVDVLFEDATIIDPRGKTHKYELCTTVATKFEIRVPHALNLANHLNNEMVHAALIRYVSDLPDDRDPMAPIPEATLNVAGHSVQILNVDPCPIVTRHSQTANPF